MNKKETRGGARPNAGRKAGKATTVISVRHDEEVITTIRDKLDPHVIADTMRATLDRLYNYATVFNKE